MRLMFGALTIAISLAGCQGTGEAVQMGKDKYRMTFWGPDNAGPPKAQEFCKQRGFAYAEVSYAVANDMQFFCMNEGDRIVSPNASRVCVGVTNCN